MALFRDPGVPSPPPLTPTLTRSASGSQALPVYLSQLPDVPLVLHTFCMKGN